MKDVAGRVAFVTGGCSGIGSVHDHDFRNEIPKIAKAVTEGAFDVRTQPIPLSDVAVAWTKPLDADKRIVFLP